MASGKGTNRFFPDVIFIFYKQKRNSKVLPEAPPECLPEKIPPEG